MSLLSTLIIIVLSALWTSIITAFYLLVSDEMGFVFAVSSGFIIAAKYWMEL